MATPQSNGTCPRADICCGSECCNSLTECCTGISCILKTFCDPCTQYYDIGSCSCQTFGFCNTGYSPCFDRCCPPGEYCVSCAGGGLCAPGLTPTPTPTVGTLPTPTPTQTVTPTPTSTTLPIATPTPTPTLPIIKLDECSILLNGSTGKVYKYDHLLNTSVELFSTTVADDIAHTSNRLWLIRTSSITEYVITENPFSYTFNRVISLPTGDLNYGPGLFAVDNLTLLSTVNQNRFVILDITANPPVKTIVFTLPTGTWISGDILQSSAGKYIISTYKPSTSEYKIMQYSLGGTLELEILLPFTNPYGLYEYSGDLFIVVSNGDIYKIDSASPYNLTLVQNPGFSINGASQKASCITFQFTL